MARQLYAKVYTLYSVKGYDWDTLSEKEKERVHNLLLSRTFHGAPKQQYGFAQTKISGDVYYGHFAQQYEDISASYTDPSHRHEAINYPFADRFYLFVPRRNLFVLERKNFVRQPGLTPRGTEARIEALLQESLPNYHIRLEKFSSEATLDEMKAYFHKFPVVGIRVSGLRGSRVSEDFIFFNPQYDKNAVARELFNEKILPYMDSIDITTDAYKDPQRVPVEAEDLRNNGLARLVTHLSTDIREIAIHHPEQGRQYVKPRYDDTIRVSSETNDMDSLAGEIMERIQEIPDIQKDIRMRRVRQARLFDD